MKRVLAIASLAVLALPFAASESRAQPVDGPVAELRLRQRGPVYVGLPFEVIVVAQGFDDTPEPTISTLEIKGCDIRYIGYEPVQDTDIGFDRNGQMVRSVTVTHVWRYLVEATSPGQFIVPNLTLAQGSLKTTTGGKSQFTAKEIDSTSDMQIRMSLPDRPVWVGEAVPISVDWYLLQQPSNPSFSVPLFAFGDWVDIAVGERSRRMEAIEFQIGDETVAPPYSVEKTVLDGVEYSRVQFQFEMTPKKTGTVELPPPTAVADIATVVRDRRGRQVRKFDKKKAEGVASTLVVRPLPMKDRPISFANAVGSGYSIGVTASRTVVGLGEPIQLTIEVRGDHLVGLSLPALDGALEAASFDIADEPTTGVVGEDGSSKTFTVTIQVKSPDVQRIPGVPFSFFNPETGQYETVTADPIAISVDGSAAVVGAGDVISGGDGSGGPAIESLVGADLSLSSRGDTLRAVMTLSDAAPVLYALYGLPLLLFGFRIWQLRTVDSRGEQSELRAAEKAAERAIAQAADEPAGDSVPKIATAIRELAKKVGRRAREADGLLEVLQDTAYDPKSASKPLDAKLREQARSLVRTWIAEHKPAKRGRGASSVAVIAVIATGLGAFAWRAHAGDDAANDIVAARNAYDTALGKGDRDQRTASFAAAEALYRDLVVRYPDRPELLTDWGNAALGARDLGSATLAYRRALHYDRSLSRAERNLSWVRERAPSWIRVNNSSGAVGSLFFWHSMMSVPQRHIAGGIAFFFGILLLVPWRRDRLRRWISIAPLAVFVAMLLSIAFERDASADGVVVASGITLKSADSAGAPPVLSSPVPAGAEATILETRGAWTQIELPDGQQGWLQSAAVDRVVPE
jgi:hypothetical protein